MGRSREFYIRREASGEALMQQFISVCLLVSAGSVCICLCVCACVCVRERDFGGVGSVGTEQDAISALTCSKITHLIGLRILHKRKETSRIREMHNKAKELGWKEAN